MIDDLSAGLPVNLAGTDVELAEASIPDQSALDTATSGADSIVHLAAGHSDHAALDR